MRAELGLPSVRGDDEKGGGMMGGFGGSMGGVGGGGKAKRPIGVKFEIPYFTTSGIQVRYLKIIEPKVSLSAVTQLVFNELTCVRSFNTRRCLGYGTSLRAATLQCGCPMCNNGIDELISNDLNCYRTGLAVSAEHGDGVLALEAVLASFKDVGRSRRHHSPPFTCQHETTSDECALPREACFPNDWLVYPPIIPYHACYSVIRYRRVSRRFREEQQACR